MEWPEDSFLRLVRASCALDGVIGRIGAPMLMEQNPDGPPVCQRSDWPDRLQFFAGQYPVARSRFIGTKRIRCICNVANPAFWNDLDSSLKRDS